MQKPHLNEKMKLLEARLRGAVPTVTRGASVARPNTGAALATKKRKLENRLSQANATTLLPQQSCKKESVVEKENNDLKRELGQARKKLKESERVHKSIIVKLLRDHYKVLKENQYAETLDQAKKIKYDFSNRIFMRGNKVEKEEEMQQEVEKVHAKIQKEKAELQGIHANEATKLDILRSKIENLERQKSSLLDQMKALRAERRLFVRELDRANCERASPFAKMPLLEKRFLVLTLLGRGGFSEVWKAFDIKENRYCALKLHQLNTRWPIEKKQNYTKHATREYKIQQALNHENIVSLLDVFAIGENAFATVMEFCDGQDLSQYLIERGALSECEARSILRQILSALIYLNSQNGSIKYSIIHYDLKPANILFFQAGRVKISDFGLAKIIENNGDTMMNSEIELTSQGAGSYWYLPPETFSAKSPKISNKVDVWSVGIIMYQMCFGKRPFGEGKSPEYVAEKLKGGAQVEFPDDIQVSPECQNFISACLNGNPRARPDIFEISKHIYLRCEI